MTLVTRSTRPITATMTAGPTRSGGPFERLVYRAVDDDSDSDPRLRRMTVATVIVGSTAVWAVILAAAYFLLT